MGTAAVDRTMVDTNILIYNSLPSSPLQPAAERKLLAAEAAGEVWVSRQIFREFIASMTRPGTANPPIPTGAVLTAVSDLAARLQVAEDGPVVFAHLLSLLAAVPCSGKQVHDANIVATMLAHGVPNLLTHNVADFTRFASYITVVPLV